MAADDDGDDLEASTSHTNNFTLPQETVDESKNQRNLASAHDIEINDGEESNQTVFSNDDNNDDHPRKSSSSISASGENNQSGESEMTTTTTTTMAETETMKTAYETMSSTASAVSTENTITSASFSASAFTPVFNSNADLPSTSASNNNYNIICPKSTLPPTSASPSNAAFPNSNIGSNAPSNSVKGREKKKQSNKNNNKVEDYMLLQRQDLKEQIKNNGKSDNKCALCKEKPKTCLIDHLHKECEKVIGNLRWVKVHFFTHSKKTEVGKLLNRAKIRMVTRNLAKKDLESSRDLYLAPNLKK